MINIQKETPTVQTEHWAQYYQDNKEKRYIVVHNNMKYTIVCNELTIISE